MAHTWYPDGGTRRLDLSTGISPNPLLGLQSRKTLVSSFSVFKFFCSLKVHLSHYTRSFGMADGDGLAQVVGLAAATCRKGTLAP